MANEAMIRAMIEEDEFKKILAQQAFNERMLAQNKASALKNQTAMTQDDVGFFQGLLGRSSEAEQRMLAGNMFPGPQLSLFDRAKNALGDAWTNDNSSYKQGIWANNQIDAQELEQEKARAVAASAADQQAGSGQLAQQLWSPGLGAPNYQPTVKAAVDQGVSGVVPPGQFNSSQGKQLSDADFARTYQEQRELMQPTVGTKVGDMVAAGGQSLYDNSIFPYMGMKDMDGNNILGPRQWADDQLNRIEAEKEFNKPENIKLRAEAEEREQKVTEERNRISLMQDAMSSYEARPTPSLMSQEREPMFPALEPYAGLPFEGGPKSPEQMMFDGLNPDVKAQMDAQRAANEAAKQQAELDVYNAQINNPTSNDVALVKTPTEINVEDDILPALENTVTRLTNDEKNDQYVEATLAGETTLGKFLDWIGVLDNDNDGVSQEDGNETVKKIAEIAETESTTEVEQGGVLSDDEPVVNTTNINSKPAAVNNGSVAVPSLMTTTSDEGTGGFTMDRLTNPLSPENKKWWMGGGAGVPGSNRAVQFFEALAYIGTPLKYRPSKTPGQQNIENRMTQMNNMMDYNSSMASKSSAPSFAALRAAVPSVDTIGDTIRGQIEADASKGFLFGLIGGDSQEDIDRKIAETSYAIREKMLQMALVNGKLPTFAETTAELYPQEPPKEDDKKEEEEEGNKFLDFFRRT